MDPREDAFTLDSIAQAYLNKNRDPSDCSEVELRCWMWCALVLGSLLLPFDLGVQAGAEDEILVQRLRAMGYIIMIATSQYLVANHDQCREEAEKRNWNAVYAGFLSHHFLCTPALRALWQHSWETTMTRQRDWEAAEALSVCAPQMVAQGDEANIVDVEYMVLQEGRESLPKI
jgi:hypothetical protein